MNAYTVFTQVEVIMQTFKYFHARASGYTPAQAVAFMRGAHLPCRPARAYVAAVNDQQLSQRIRRALSCKWAGGQWGWKQAWHEVRRADYEQIQAMVSESGLPRRITHCRITEEL
jgi:hypothetical protein